LCVKTQIMTEEFHDAQEYISDNKITWMSGNVLFGTLTLVLLEELDRDLLDLCCLIDNIFYYRDWIIFNNINWYKHY